MKKVLFASVLVILIAGTYIAQSAKVNNLPSVEAYSSVVPTEWYALQVELIKTTPGYTPPVVARTFGYTGLALYEALRPGMDDYNSILTELGYLDVLPESSADSDGKYNWDAVANKVLAEMTRELFSNTSGSGKEKIDALEATLHEKIKPDVSRTTLEHSEEYAVMVAKAVLDFAATDGGYEGQLHNLDTSYVPPEGEGLWVKTPALYQYAMQPTWGENRYLVSKSETECELPPHPEFSTSPASEFYAEAFEVYDTVNNLTQEQDDIARMWADESVVTPTPPGHWIAILNNILRDGDYNLEQSAEVYARTGIAISDSFIACWQEKYKYNLIRPITYIHRYIDPNWDVAVANPNFPEYPSGHSVQSGAAAAVLTDFFGENFAFTDSTNVKKGLEPRSFSSFEEAAEEAAISRLYGGIHYRSAIYDGLEFGECIGEKVNQIKLKN